MKGPGFNPQNCERTKNLAMMLYVGGEGEVLKLTVVDDAGVWATCSHSLSVPLDLHRAYLYATLQFYSGLLLGPPGLSTWQV
jgi:hypothetical protein